MLLQEIDLTTLEFILSQFSEDIADDCSKVIAKLLKSISLSVFHGSKMYDEKVFASVKVLLNLYELLNANNSNTKSELPINIIIEKVKLIFQCNFESCILPENVVKLNILSIISSVFKIGLLQNRSWAELIKFHDYNLHGIRTAIAKEECKSKCLIFKLKVLTVIYQVLGNVKFESFVSEFSEKIKSVNEAGKQELFVDLALHEDDSIAFQTLFHLVPAQINCFKSNRVLEIIWKRLTASVFCDAKYSRVLIILCQIFDLCWDKPKQLKDQVDLTKLLFEDVNYWKLVQFALKDKDPAKRKQGFYLFKKTVDVLNTENKSIFCGNDTLNFYWHFDYRNELYKVYSEIITALEFLEEQQIHIIEPVFKLVETVTENILNSNKVNFSWILVIYEKALSHESLQVVKWGLTNLLKMQKNFFTHEHFAIKSAELLVVTLNNMPLYFNNGLAISQDLKAFFDTISTLNTSKVFFKAFIKKLCCQVWSAEALFFVIHSLSVKYPSPHKFKPWGKEEIYEITKFVLKAFKTHNKLIRIGIQMELLNVCLNLTDEKDVPLENFIFLISIFFDREIVKVGNENWENLKFWLKNYYSREDAKTILEKYLMEKSRERPKFMSLMFILFYYAYGSDSFEMESYLSPLESHDRNKFPLNYFQEILLSYKEIYKRPYCNKLMHDQNLSMICDIYEANLKNYIPSFIRPTLPFLDDVILYIQSQLSQISGLQDFSEMELYLKTFENITKTLESFKFEFGYADTLYKELLKEFKSNSQLDLNICSIGMFWRMKLLKIILKLNFIKPNPSILDSYLLETVNKPLKKDKNYSEKTKDLLMQWGKLNSEFLEGKWEILEYLINKKLVRHGCVKNESSVWISNNDLTELCVEALNIGGYGVLRPVMSILKKLLPTMESDLKDKIIIDSIWKLILERKKTDMFKVFVREFIEMVFQEAFIDKGEPATSILLEYAELIFSDSSISMAHILMRHAQRIEITKSVPLFCFVVGKGLIFGPVEKKDDRLSKTVCSHIENLKIFNCHEISDYNTSNEIRARAVQKILKLNKKSPAHQTLARQLIDTLLKMENELNKNRIRYFGNSHVHRVKHRVMQALLLLEPLLNPNEDQALKLSKWIIHSLMSENSQPSVRYMQEWLLVRILARHSEVYSRFDIFYCCKDLEETKKKSLCSLLGILYHFCRIINSDIMKLRITTDLHDILYFCFHRHFELRLYAQVVFLNFYKTFAKLEKFSKILQPYENIYKALNTCISEECVRNKTLRKLFNNFYFDKFHPLHNYSLETIYKDLPRLTEVGIDEWISAKMFRSCGVESTQIDVPLEDPNFSLKSLEQDTWLWKTFELSMPAEFDQGSKNCSDNYQKKIIPIKSLIPVWDDDNYYQNTVKKDGLVVVASLIDRIPNLGGLARTCEVFGASEYIINSLKYTDDKQFTSLSVTAEKWITVKEVKIQNLFDYISEMKQNGYTIIGAEQALFTQPLNEVKFPKKSLLLLGNEKEGIPPNLMPFLDVCVEIPQLGLIRSLNVHVTGALFIWEYAKQHHFSKYLC